MNDFLKRLIHLSFMTDKNCFAVSFSILGVVSIGTSTVIVSCVLLGVEQLVGVPGPLPGVDDKERCSSTEILCCACAEKFGTGTDTTRSLLCD